VNFRSQILLSCLEHVSAAYPDEPLNVIEVSCMFRETEGLSTYLIADLLAQRPGGGRFVSIEYDGSHIEASREIVNRHNASLSEQIEYRHGHSLCILPEALAECHPVHLVYLDGGAHPEVCLVEFELAAKKLAPEGVILVDDAHRLAPNDIYQLPRPVAKATLILPMLILANYLENRDFVRTANSMPGDPRSIPDSDLVRQSQHFSFLGVKDFSFATLGRGHQMLVNGSHDVVSDVATVANAEPVVCRARKTVRHRFRLMRNGWDRKRLFLSR
jgi:hypothetical protein